MQSCFIGIWTPVCTVTWSYSIPPAGLLDCVWNCPPISLVCWYPNEWQSCPAVYWWLPLSGGVYNLSESAFSPISQVINQTVSTQEMLQVINYHLDFRFLRSLFLSASCVIYRMVKIPGINTSHSLFQTNHVTVTLGITVPAGVHITEVSFLREILIDRCTGQGWFQACAVTDGDCFC